MTVAVIGAGKMGLPLACQFAHCGASVIACDVNGATVSAINLGHCPIDEPGVPELLRVAVQDGRLRATTETVTAVSQSDVVVVIVPALLTDESAADLSILESASRQIAIGLRPGTIVCYETTVPVGTTRCRLGPLLEQGGLRAGTDFALVFSPERVKSQSVLKHLTRTPKVVGGVDEESANRGEAFYSRYLGAPVINVGTLEAAELVKLAGMIYRDVNIALANELATYAEMLEVDLEPVIQAANTDGEAFLLRPGIGVGGHCTPVYPHFLTREARRCGTPVTLAERARQVNDGQAAAALDRLERGWDQLRGQRVLILGLSFRPQVKEHLYSTAFMLREHLQLRGAEVTLHDPLYTVGELQRLGFRAGSPEDTPAPNVIILNTAHEVYQRLDFMALARQGLQAVFDGRNLWEPVRVQDAGIAYFGVGRQGPEESLRNSHPPRRHSSVATADERQCPGGL